MSEVVTWTKNMAKLYKYVEDFFARTGNTEWPTIRQTARSLKISQKEVAQLVEDHDDLFTSYYNVEGRHKLPLGDFFIESTGDA